MSPFKLFPVLFFLAILSNPSNSAPLAAVYASGEIYPTTPNYLNNIQTLKQSGFNTVLVWCIHVHANGDLYYNDDKIISNGDYVGHSDWPTQLAQLTTSSTINRVYFSVGSYGVSDFQNIHNLLQNAATTATLIDNFRTLKSLVPDLYGIDFDNEDYFENNDAVVDFALLLGDLDLQVSFCVYNNQLFWVNAYKAVEKEHSGLVKEFFVQVYAGGEYNDPISWKLLTNLVKLLQNPPKLYPGLWCLHENGEGSDPSTMQRRFSFWKTFEGIDGGFVWMFGDILRYGPSAGAYANAIKTGLS